MELEPYSETIWAAKRAAKALADSCPLTSFILFYPFLLFFLPN